MATNVRTAFKNFDFKLFVDDTLLKRIQDEVIEGMIKTSIEVGNSPVEGFGRYVGYAAERNRKLSKNKSLEQGYPFSARSRYPGKALRPVNLKLSGELMSFYTCKQASDTSVFIGIQEDAPPEVLARAEGNNLGTAPGVPARRFVPIGGEVYKIDIMTALRDILADRLIAYIKETD